MGDTTDTSRIFDVFSKNDVVTSATSKISNMYESVSSNSTLFFGLLAVVVITVIIAALLYMYIGWQLFAKVQNTVEDTKIPVIGNELTKMITNIDPTNNGNRRSYSFWIYINDINKYRGQYKNVLGITADGTKYKSKIASPHIFLDDYNNTMYIRFAKKTNSESGCKYISSNEDLATYMRQGIEIKYIPLQRWVHIAIVCNADSYKTTLYAYVDGDLIKTIGDKDSFFLNKDKNINKEADISDINLDGAGFLYVGGNPISDCGNGFSGLISNFTTYNYELNNKDIYNIYNKGPITGLLAALGLGAYGVRSPIYKL